MGVRNWVEYFLLFSKEGLGIGSCQERSKLRLVGILAVILVVMLALGLAMRGEDGRPSIVVVVAVVVVELTLCDPGGVRMPYWVAGPFAGAGIPEIAVDRRMFSGAGGEVGLDDDE